MSPETTAAIISGCFSVLTLGITFWVRRRWGIFFELEKQRLIAQVRAGLANEKELSKYFEQYFIKLEAALSAFKELCHERNLALDTKPFIAAYSSASDKWSGFKAYSAKKETLSLSKEFLAPLSAMKEAIEQLTIELSMERATRLRRRAGYENLLAIATQRRDELAEICRSKRAGS